MSQPASAPLRRRVLRTTAASAGCCLVAACGGYQLPVRHGVLAATPLPSSTPAAAPGPIQTAVPWWFRTATPSAVPRFTPDPTPNTRIDLCADPGPAYDRESTILAAQSGAPSGGRARGELDNMHNSDGDGSLDVKAFGCGLDTTDPNRYYAVLVQGAGGCTVTSRGQVWFQVGYLALLDDNRTLYVIGQRSNSTPVPADTWMGIYDAGANGANRASSQLVFCGHLGT